MIRRRKPLQQGDKPLRRTPLSRGDKPLARSMLQPGRPPVKPRKQSPSSEVPRSVRAAVLARDGHACQLCGASVEDRPYSLQHRRPRQMGGSSRLHTMANLVTLCGTATTGCHGHVEDRRVEATRCGWLVPNGVSPEEWPVLRLGVRWEQPGEVWVPCAPHPRQLEAA